MNPLVAQMLRQMTDRELLEAISNPLDGQFLKVRPHSQMLIDGNTRYYEMIRRIQANPNSLFSPDLHILVEVVL